MAKAISGVIPVLSTPFTTYGGLDLHTLKTEVEWVIEQGVNAVATGMVSEILKLTIPERKHHAQAICEAAKPSNTPVIISCGTESERETINLCVHAEESGADVLMINPPITVSLSDEELEKYYRKIFEATSSPIMVQDASGYVGRPISLSVLANLFKAYSERIYFKPEAIPIGQRLSSLRDLTEGKAKIFEGTGGAHLVDSYARGAIGTMPGPEFSWAFVYLWKQVTAGNWKEINPLNGAIANLVNLMPILDAYVAIEKYYLHKQGVFKNTVSRAPRGFYLDEETQQECDRLFDLINDLVKK
jgi:dihydrodipicolinate synthase/N-acetylneuraminate lyase